MPETKTDIPDEDLRAIDEAMPQWVCVFDGVGGRRIAGHHRYAHKATSVAAGLDGYNPTVYRRANTPTGWQRVDEGEVR